MYLKSIEMKGFKSFADKTELEFKGGITAVVGPNGSGKSNISDAIRWVLGEQSVKQLRGGKMEDVIFAGTQFRKPLGQAQVTLTLDNSCGTLNLPYNEVNVTRRLYRSGESEYLLNNNQVRLKDIHELFMDTGIGREGYSMIGQGKIDAILSGKADERRGLIEEAAGITKYKSRKEEGERKLKNAEDNLTRVEDIISTYEERLGPLKKEKETAEKFVVLDKELKKLQISVFIKDLDELEEKNIGFIKAKEATELSYRELEVSFLNQEEKTKKVEEDLIGAEDLRAKKREDFFIKKGDLQRNDSEKRILENTLNNNRESILRFETALKENKKEVDDLKGLNEEKIDKEKVLKVEYEVIKKDLKELNERIEIIEEEIKGLEDKSDELKGSNIKLTKSISDLNEELSEKSSSKDYIRGKIENLSTMSNSYISSLNLNEDGLNKLERELKSLDEAKREINSIIVEKEGKINSLKAKREALIKEIEDLRRIVRDSQNREGILKNLEESLEGYVRPVKDLFNYLKKKNSPYIDSAQVVGDVVGTDSKYAIAIEAALGGYVGNVITDTDKDAGELIKILKNENFGRVTFLPRNVIRANKIALPRVNDVKVLGFASDLVTTEEKNKEIIDSILARTLVTENLDGAIKLARQTNHKIKIVTLEGDILSAGGAMTGGSQKGGKAGVISRKAEIEDLKRISEESIAKGIKLKGEEEEVKLRINALEEDLTSEKNREINLKLETEKISERLVNFKKERDKVRDLIKNQTLDEESLKRDLESALKEISILEGKKDKLTEEKDNILYSIEEIRSKKATVFKQLDDVRLVATDKRIEEGRLKSNLELLEDEIGKNKLKIESLSIKNKDLINSLEVTREEINNIEDKITIKEEEIISLTKVLESLEKEGEALELKETKIKAELKEETNRLETVRDEKNRVEKELIKVNMSLEKYEAEKEDIITRLNEDLNLTVAEARDEVIELESKTKAKKRISELKSSISSLGTINLTAIEEYSKVSDHYEYLTKQKNDLLNAKEELLNLIKDMTGKMRSLFKENFTILSKNFKETFKELFNGGTAELVLVDGDELNGNIDIIVQPPGKKLQNINLLSGGEKVLSAIALTFGILKMKPSPFCILDEIEAALDDANVYRYASFLKDFAKDTQFILITHRKGTMEAANLMYGVTMEEKGISKIVSVNLEENIK